MAHTEWHRLDRVGWLRAAVLGANDGIVSTASLVVGVAGSGAGRDAIIVAGVAGLVAGAMSMAAGEYVSVSSQADTEAADIARETEELAVDPGPELDELTRIYAERGLEPALARQVAEQLTAKDALGAHLRDELGITEHQRARPLQAALASALTFALGAALPLVAAWLTPVERAALVVTGSSLAFLVLLGGIAARAGGASAARGALRVAFWGAFAMALTYGVGRLFGAVVA
jgi:VIT1/CCC1 family predicted Fe2+/Mn2+ transporter